MHPENGIRTAVFRSRRHGAHARWFTGERPRRAAVTALRIRVKRLCASPKASSDLIYRTYPARLNSTARHDRCRDPLRGVPSGIIPAMAMRTGYITDIKVRFIKALMNHYWYPFLTR